MAKTTGGLLSLGARGTIGSVMTFAKWRGRPYVRQRVIPANPNTVAQQTTRNLFSNAHSIWKQMQAVPQAPWDAFAKGKPLTGQNAFIGRFTKDLRGDPDLADMTFSPGSQGGLAPASVVFTPTVGGVDVALTAPTLPLGWSITEAQAAGVTDGVPGSLTNFGTFSDVDATAPYLIQFVGLLNTESYAIGAWFKYAKADGTEAYGPSVTSVETPL